MFEKQLRFQLYRCSLLSPLHLHYLFLASKTFKIVFSKSTFSVNNLTSWQSLGAISGITIWSYWSLEI